MTGKELLPLIHAKGRGDRMSENLYKWVKKEMRRRGDKWDVGVSYSAHSMIDGSEVLYDPAKTQPSHIILTTLPADECTFGARLSGIINKGAKAETFAFPNNAFKISVLPDWWQGYIDGGKCFIDPEHRIYFDRWQLSDDGNTRDCIWCGKHVQRKRVEMVPREHWDNVTDLVMRGEER